MGKTKRIGVDTRTGLLRINGLDIDITTLVEITDPNPRVLWSFQRDGDRIKAVAYDESMVIWLEESDLVRTPNDPLYK